MPHLTASPSRLQAAHAAAIQRANTIAARESGVISIYALGTVIAEIELDQIHHTDHGHLAEAITCNSIIRRLRALLPIQP